MNQTSIEWCNRPETRGPVGAKTWNPIRANLKGPHAPRPHSGTFCTRISPGCQHCYASTINKRFGNGLEFTVPNLERIEFFLDEHILEEPVKQKKPCTIFVGDMFDLFHEAIPAEFIAEVFRVALKTPRHTFQFLTKRAERMRKLVNYAQEYWGVKFGEHMWFGVSVEDNERALDRIPSLQETRAAVRFLSIEPQLEAVDLWSPRYRFKGSHTSAFAWGEGINWVICGGESGPGARPFNLAWAESLQKQCAAANVPFFMKQIGSNPWLPNDMWRGLTPPKIRDRKGGNPAEWPEHLRVREFPARQKAEVVRA